MLPWPKPGIWPSVPPDASSAVLAKEKASLSVILHVKCQLKCALNIINIQLICIWSLSALLVLVKMLNNVIVLLYWHNPLILLNKCNRALIRWHLVLWIYIYISWYFPSFSKHNLSSTSGLEQTASNFSLLFHYNVHISLQPPRFKTKKQSFWVGYYTIVTCWYSLEHLCFKIMLAVFS